MKGVYIAIFCSLAAVISSLVAVYAAKKNQEGPK
jgi:hypothetical protein